MHKLCLCRQKGIQMELFNLLAGEAQIAIFGQTFDVSLGLIGPLIRGLILGVGSVGVGIILFSLILKAIVLPFDVYQRISMRKQNKKMEENKERMEKLQKQYANDKEAYSRKVMEMYKESGISVLSSCLPMILSMVIFFVALGGFNAYSQYANVENYNIMVNAYNTKIQTMMTELGSDVCIFDETNKQYTVIIEKAAEKDAGIQAAIDAALTANTENKTQAEVEKEAVEAYFTSAAQDAVLEAYNTDVKKNVSFLWIKNIWETDASYKHPVLSYTDFKAQIEREDFVVGDNDKATLTDAMNATVNSPYDSFAYEIITGKLTEAKSQSNGFYILIVLSIGTILLQQFVSMRSQKAQQQYSSVDGQGASQQKTMMVTMTAMFAIFAFMYSASFSIYMITSNILSLLSMLIINKIVDIALEKKAAKDFQAKYNKRFPAYMQKETGKKSKKQK